MSPSRTVENALPLVTHVKRFLEGRGRGVREWVTMGVEMGEVYGGSDEEGKFSSGPRKRRGDDAKASASAFRMTGTTGDDTGV